MVELVDWPTTFPKLWGILGWNIYLYHSHIDVTPAESTHHQNWHVAWHQDSMRVNDEIECHPRPRLSLKIGYYLTDDLFNLSKWSFPVRATLPLASQR